MQNLQNTPAKKGVLINMSIFLIFTPRIIMAILLKSIFLTVLKNLNKSLVL